jgi:cation diffusion facilitator family transporter
VASESHKTVYLALGANAGIAVAKFAGALISGSSALLAEAAHSVADTTNQLFLLASLNLSERAPDDEHPFGYGKERFFWSFLAAVFIFVSGALFSIYEGVRRMLSPESETGSPGIAFAVLGVALVLEGASLARAVRQNAEEARRRRRPLSRHLRTSRDPTTKTVVFEDGAAVTGVVLAAAGLGLTLASGSPVWDGAASVLIGLLLAAVAFTLGRDTKDLLIGEAATPDERAALARVFEEHPQVDALVELLTMALSPSSLLVAARIDLAQGLDSDAIEALADDLDRSLREAVPDVGEVFLDPTGHGRRRVRAP